MPPSRCRRPAGGCDSSETLESLEPVLKLIEETKRAKAVNRALVVGLSGIDGSGKSHIARQLLGQLTQADCNVALIPIDEWLHHSLDHSRVSPEEFYVKGVRFADLFENALLPLLSQRTVSIVLIEGIFLFQAKHDAHLDLKIWVECSFGTALQRAITRGQEGLSPDETRRAFERLYFPAQRLHLERDHPRETANYRFENY